MSEFAEEMERKLGWDAAACEDVGECRISSDGECITLELNGRPFRFRDCQKLVDVATRVIGMAFAPAACAGHAYGMEVR